MTRNTFRIDRKISIGDILTVLTIIGSVLAALYSWQKDRDIKREEQANHIRAAAATTLAKLDRWKTLSLSTFDNVEPLFVDVKENLRRHYDLVEARHEQWKNILKVELDSKQKIIDEDVAAGYTDLSSYDAKARDNSIDMLERLNAEQEKAFNELLQRTQDVLLTLKRSGVSYQCYQKHSDLLYNSLVFDIANPIRDAYSQRLYQIIHPADLALANVVKQSKEELLDGRPSVTITLPKVDDSPLLADPVKLGRLQGCMAPKEAPLE